MIAELVSLKDALRLSIDSILVDASQSYPIAGVYSFGRGLLSRPPIFGSETTYKTLNRLHRDDFVLSQLKAWEGALAKVTASHDGWFLSPQFPTFRAIPERLDISYLDWYCRQADVWDKLRSTARGMGDRRDSVSPERFLSLEIPLPPLAEQQRIVARIEELVAKINEARELRQQVQQVVGSLLGFSVSGLCRSSNRKTITVGDLVGEDYLRNGRSVKSIGDIGEVRCLTLSAMRNGRIDIRDNKVVPLTLDEAKPFLIRKGDVFIVRGNGSKNLCGLAGLVTEESRSVIFPDLFIHVPLPKHCIVPEFFVAVWNSPATRRVIEEKAKTTSGIWKVNQGHINSTEIPVPSLPEQHRIVSALDALQSEVAELKKLQAQTAAELDALLPSILNKAFNGYL